MSNYSKEKAMFSSFCCSFIKTYVHLALVIVICSLPKVAASCTASSQTLICGCDAHFHSATSTSGFTNLLILQSAGISAPKVACHCQLAKKKKTRKKTTAACLTSCVTQFWFVFGLNTRSFCFSRLELKQDLLTSGQFLPNQWPTLSSPR